MSNLSFKFNQEKAVEVILYIAHKIPDPTFHSVSKILYFADKTSLERYGRFICGETYYAMEHGPVPTNIYNLMKDAVTTEQYGFKVENERVLVPLRQPDQDQLSESDLLCLDQMIELYGNMPFWKKTEDSHDAAWERAWNERGSKSSNMMAIEDIVKLLEDSESLLDHLRNQHTD